MLKRISILIYLLAACGSFAHAQGTLYGTTRHGGSKGGGTIFRVDTDGTNFTTEYNISLDANPGKYFGEFPLLNINNKLYGVSQGGGIMDLGTIFEYDPATNVLKTLYQWPNYNNGSSPTSGLVTFGGNNSILYGMTNYVIYSYNLATSTYTKLADLDSQTIGYGYSNGLTEYNGLFYGTSTSSGNTGKGTIYKFDPATKVITKLIDMPVANTTHALVLGPGTTTRKFYFMTSNGGTADQGAIYEFDPLLPTTINLKYSFTTAGALGYAGYNNLLTVGEKIYGVATYGGTQGVGTFFEYDPATNTAVKKVDFGTATTLGNGQVYFLSKGTTDNLIYGASMYNGGAIFEYNLTTSTYTKKTEFNHPDQGSYPYGGITLVNGKFYGINRYEGGSYQGSLFEFIPTTGVVTKKLDFQVGAAGITPENNLIYENGKLYGLNAEGGSKGYGTIFEFDPLTKVLTKKFDFTDYTLTGVRPLAPLVKATDGKFYGTTSNGGTNGAGVLFSYDIATSTLTKKYDFVYNTDGQNPNFAMVVLNAKLYGVCQSGGTAGWGTIFEYDYVASTFKKLYDFPDYYSAQGSYPGGPLIAASDKKLYGTTANGGNIDPVYSNITNGALFQFDPATKIYIKKVDFTHATGGSPQGTGLLEYTPGKLYGILSYDGEGNAGTFFEYTLETSVFSKKLDLDYQKGNYSQSGLVAGDGGRYFFTCNNGETVGGTVAFYNPVSGEYSRIVNFIGTNGAHPGYGSLVKTPLVFDITPPVIGTDNTAKTATSGVSVDVNVIVTDSKSPVTAVKVSYQSTSSSGAPTVTAMNRVGTTDQYLFTIPGTFVGELGVQYKIIATSAGGTTDETTTRFTSVPVTSTNSTINYTSAGATAANYRIIAVPYNLNIKSASTVFDELAPFNKKKWRLSHYKAGATSELVAASSIEPGLGYWLLMKTAVSVSTGGGLTVPTATDLPFSVAVDQNLNQIGNPYPFKINWADVVAVNAGVSDNVKVYNGGWANATSLNAGEGGFVTVNQTALTTLKFPPVKAAARMDGDKNRFKNPLTENNWQLYIDAKQADLVSGIAGIGMHQDARAGIDRFDDANMPRFFERYLEINHNQKVSSAFDSLLNKEVPIYLAKDIVPSSREHVWEFNVASDGAEQFTTLQWDNTFFGDNEMTLVLWDEARQLGIDMRTEKEYTFDRFISGDFKVYYGEKGKLVDKVGVTKLVLHSVSPNPAESDVKIAFSVPEDRIVTFEAIDLTGRKLWTSTSDFRKGYHEVVWSNEYRHGAKGIYIIQVKSGAEAGTARINLK